MAEKTYLTSLEKVCKGAQRGGLSLEQNEVSGGRVTEQKYRKLCKMLDSSQWPLET